MPKFYQEKFSFSDKTRVFVAVAVALTVGFALELVVLRYAGKTSRKAFVISKNLALSKATGEFSKVIEDNVEDTDKVQSILNSWVARIVKDFGEDFVKQIDVIKGFNVVASTDRKLVGKRYRMLNLFRYARLSYEMKRAFAKFEEAPVGDFAYIDTLWAYDTFRSYYKVIHFMTADSLSFNLWFLLLASGGLIVFASAVASAVGEKKQSLVKIVSIGLVLLSVLILWHIAFFQFRDDLVNRVVKSSKHFQKVIDVFVDETRKSGISDEIIEKSVERLVSEMNVDELHQPLYEFKVKDLKLELSSDFIATKQKVYWVNMLFLSIFTLILSVLILMWGLNGGIERFLNNIYNFSTAYSFIAPAMVAMLILIFIPLLFTVVLSFTNLPKIFTELDLGRRFIGLANYSKILGFSGEEVGKVLVIKKGVVHLYKSVSFYYTLKITFLYTFVSLIVQVIAGVLLGIVLSERNLAFRGIYQVLFILPWVIPTYVSGLLWHYAFGYRGFLNQLFAFLGLNPVNWMATTTSKFLIISFVSAWYAFPFIMIVTMSAMSTIPESLEDAAKIDGAGWFDKLFYITLPLIKGTITPAIVLSSIWTFNNFNLVYLVTGGDDTVDILITRIYDFLRPDTPETYGFAAAYSTVIFLVLLVYIIAFAKITRLTEKVY